MIRILLIEDDEQDYCLFRNALKYDSREFFVEWAASMTEALPLIRHGRFHVIVTDLTLPDCRGTDVLQQIKRACIDTPIIVWSTTDDDQIGQSLLDGGAHDYLVKGDGSGRNTVRSIVHAVQRHQNVKQMKAMVEELEAGREALREQTRLLSKKNRRLKRLYKTAQEFVDNVSHDLRTPLTVIKDYAAIVNDELVGELNPKQKTMLSKVLVRADDLNNMVDDLLDGSKLRSGLLSVWRRSTDLAEVVQRTRSLVQQRADAKEIELEIQCPEQLPPAYCDPEKVVRILTNLAINAIKYSEQGGSVRFVCRTDALSRNLIVDVIDSGPGIEPEALERIFQRFQRLSCRITASVKGFGLGLSIAEHLAQLNLGKLSVESEVGKGSTFSVELPMMDPKEIVRRTLERCSLDKNHIVYVGISIPESVESVVDEFDGFLQGVLRRYDALIKLDNQRWVWVMIGQGSETGDALKRLDREFQRYNRNRPNGSLPDYEVDSLFASKAGETKAKAIEAFSRILDQYSNQGKEIVAYE